MEIKDAENVAQKIVESLTVLTQNSKRYERVKSELESNKKKLSDLNKQLREAKVFKRYYEKILFYSSVNICTNCDGKGYFSIDMGEMGGDYEMCVECEGQGVIDKLQLPEKNEQ